MSIEQEMSGAVVLGLSCPHLWSLYSLAQLAANVLTPKSVYCTYINPHPNSVQHEFSVCHVIPKVVAAVTTNSVLLLPRFSLLFCLSKKLAVAPRTANCQSFGGGSTGSGDAQSLLWAFKVSRAFSPNCAPVQCLLWDLVFYVICHTEGFKNGEIFLVPVA